MSDADVIPSDRLAPGTPSSDDVREELQRVLASADFPASTKRRSFLRFIVDETLAGRAERLKAYSVAIAVFGRDETFDAQTDPVVRLEARRLRRDLDAYYVDRGRKNPVRISIPKGSYVPRFEWHESVQIPPALPPRQHDNGDTEKVREARVVSARRLTPTADRFALRGLIAIAGVLTVIAVGLALNWIFLARPRQSPPAADGPAIVVLPFTALGSTEQSLYLAHGLSEELIRNLMMFPSFRVYTSPIKLNGSSFVEPAKTGRDLGASYVVTGSVRDEASTVRVTAAMLEAATGRVLWTETYDRPLVPEALIRAERDLAGEIATALGQPYGIVNTDLSSQAATPAVSNMRSYICVLRAYGYRRGFERSQFDRVLACLEETVRQEPHYSDAWAMLGWLHLDAGRLGYGGNSTRASKYQIALDATSKAVQIEPNNALALKALAAVNHYLGRYDESEKLIRRALELNPYDPDAMAQLGWRLAVRGRFDEGIPILKEAIERTLSPPGWYFALIAIDLYLKADYKKMLQVADRTAANGTGFGQLLVAVGAGALGDRGRAQTALKKMTEYKELSADPAALMRVHGATDEIVNALMAGLAKAHQVAASSKDDH